MTCGRAAEVLPMTIGRSADELRMVKNAAPPRKGANWMAKKSLPPRKVRIEQRKQPPGPHEEGRLGRRHRHMGSRAVPPPSIERGIAYALCTKEARTKLAAVPRLRHKGYAQLGCRTPLGLEKREQDWVAQHGLAQAAARDLAGRKMSQGLRVENTRTRSLCGSVRSRQGPSKWCRRNNAIGADAAGGECGAARRVAWRGVRKLHLAP